MNYLKIIVFNLLLLFPSCSKVENKQNNEKLPSISNYSKVENKQSSEKLLLVKDTDVIVKVHEKRIFEQGRLKAVGIVIEITNKNNKYIFIPDIRPIIPSIYIKEDNLYRDITYNWLLNEMVYDENTFKMVGDTVMDIDAKYSNTFEHYDLVKSMTYELALYLKPHEKYIKNVNISSLIKKRGEYKIVYKYPRPLPKIPSSKQADENNLNLTDSVPDSVGLYSKWQGFMKDSLLITIK
jgi:hypothetical protein